MSGRPAQPEQSVCRIAQDPQPTGGDGRAADQHHRAQCRVAVGIQPRVQSDRGLTGLEDEVIGPGSGDQSEARDLRAFEYRPQTRADRGKIEPRAAGVGEPRRRARRGPQLEQQVALLAPISAGKIIQLLPADPGTDPPTAAAPIHRTDPQPERPGTASVSRALLEVELQSEPDVVRFADRLRGSGQPAETALPLRAAELGGEGGQSASREQQRGGMLAVHSDRAGAATAMHRLACNSTRQLDRGGIARVVRAADAAGHRATLRVVLHRGNVPVADVDLGAGERLRAGHDDDRLVGQGVHDVGAPVHVADASATHRQSRSPPNSSRSLPNSATRPYRTRRPAPSENCRVATPTRRRRMPQLDGYRSGIGSSGAFEPAGSREVPMV